ncbi:MAG TPA: hypothetical protein VFX98_11785, partial [Longimicrobiaceae bacterium]|nr:hypothetical protein [Longimicrobiaceae bacterium]
RSDAAVLAAVARDPFRADRKRPPGRYRMPGEAVTLPETPAPVAMEAPAPVYLFRLLGTVVMPGGGLAALAGQAGEGRVVRVGQEFEGFRLTRVGPATATLVGPDTTLVLQMDNPTGGTQ